MTTHRQDRVSIVAYSDGDGEPVKETLWAVELGPGRYRLVRSPLLAAGLAAGDVFVVDDDSAAATVVERAGNVSVQVWAKSGLDMDDVYRLRDVVSGAGGTLDGHNLGFAAFTLPWTVGFTTIERIFNEFIERHPNYSWTYGNVYGDDDAPLNWWVPPSK